ncbi:MAG: transglutaminase domain-containing protein, partial [Flavobacteriaceae bacterium]|nr:transglutaminase domain-containing protein [Flavobacteriaceae bacterium]
MRPFAFILVVCLYITGLYSQDFQDVDLKVQAYPKDYSAPEQLAAQITKDFTKDEEKVRAVYYWLASNISYDMDAYFNDSTYVSFTYVDAEDFRRKSAAIDAYSVRSTFKKRRAVCEGFAQSFRRVCELLKIPC